MPETPVHHFKWRRLRKALFIIMLFALLLGATCQREHIFFLTQEERSWLETHEEELEVLIEDDLPPYVFHDENGQYTGLFIDYLHEVEAKLNLRFTLREFPIWSDLLAHAQTHNRFIILGINRTDERARYLTFTDPVVKIPYAIVTQKSNQAASIAEFNDKTLCVVKNYAVNDDLRRYYPHIIPTPVKTSLKGLHSVSSGSCDAMVINQMEASYLIDALGLTNLQIAGQTQFLNRLSLATSMTDPILFSILEKTMEHISPRRRREIYHRWVSTGHSELPYALIITLEIGAGIVLSVIFLLWAWTSSLRKQVSHQTRQIQESNENLRITLNSIGDGVLATDTRGRVTHLNPVAVTLTGWSRVEAEGEAIDTIFHLESIDTSPLEVPVDASTDERFETEATTHEAILISKTHTPCRIHYSVSPIRDEAKETTGMVFVFRDITDKVKAEAELLRIKKLESLGILAGGIAHDFNNLLTGVYGNISMAKMELSEAHRAHEYLSYAEESMDAAVALTSQFLTFSKNEKPVRRIINIGKALADAASFTAHGLNTKLETAIDDNLWSVSADKGQLSQVMSNLIINAHQSMTTGGLITLTAKNIEKAQGRWVRIVVKDMGTGIAPEHMDKIFDPYFTTKKMGSGLGLATTYAIITKHKGTIKVKSKLMEGTTFTIDLPASAEPLPHPIDKRLEFLIDTHALQVHILVLDDQVVIRKILATILKKLGFEVTFTVEGHETVDAYKKKLDEGTPYDVVILDLTIPGGMGGKEVSKKILAMDSSARIILSSGYASDPIMSCYENFGIKAIAVKPYRFSDFKETLLRVLLDR